MYRVLIVYGVGVKVRAIVLVGDDRFGQLRDAAGVHPSEVDQGVGRSIAEDLSVTVARINAHDFRDYFDVACNDLADHRVAFHLWVLCATRHVAFCHFFRALVAASDVFGVNFDHFWFDFHLFR